MKPWINIRRFFSPSRFWARPRTQFWRYLIASVVICQVIASDLKGMAHFGTASNGLCLPACNNGKLDVGARLKRRTHACSGAGKADSEICRNVCWTVLVLHLQQLFSGFQYKLGHFYLLSGTWIICCSVASVHSLHLWLSRCASARWNNTKGHRVVLHRPQETLFYVCS